MAEIRHSGMPERHTGGNPLPEGWTTTELGKVVEYGRTQKVELKDVDHSTWVLELEDIEKGTSKLLQRLNASERAFKSTKNKFEAGDVLYGKLRPYLNKVIIADDAGVCTTEIIPLNAEPAVSNRYLFHWLKGKDFLEYVNEVSYGVNMPRLGTKDGVAAPLVLPPLAEQKVIAEKLDTLLAQVDTTKARLERIPDIIKRFRQSVLAAAVSGKLTEESSSYRTIEVKDTWAHEVEGPADWLEYKFSDVIKIIGGSQPPKSDFSTEDKDGYIRLIQIRDYKSDAHRVFIPIEKAKRLVSKDDVMIGRYGPPIFQILRGLEGAYNVALMKAEPNPNLLDREYLFWYLQNYKLFNYINAGSDRTAGQAGVNKRHLESYPILLPTMDEQNQIVRRVEELFAFADTIEQKAAAALERVNNLTQSILAKAFRGELTADWRAANPELISGDNSAEALLAKIQAEREALKPVKKTRKKKAKA